jgi:hypothetical protein
MGLFQQIQGPIKSVLNSLLADDDLSQAYTYRLYIGQVFNETLGYNVDTFRDTEVTGLLLMNPSKLTTPASSGMAQTSQQDVPGFLEMGDKIILFKWEDLPEGVSLKDQIITPEGETMVVKNIDRIFNLAASYKVETQPS